MRGACRYKTPLHLNGVTDTSSSVAIPALGLKFNPRVSIISFLLIAGFVVWCMFHQVCDMTDAGTCSYGDYNQADCAAFGSVSARRARMRSAMPSDPRCSIVWYV